MPAVRPLTLLLLATVSSSASAQPPPPTLQPDVFAYVRVLDEAATKNLWPGFDPSQWPVALFDGEKTVLLRHPSPPPEFVAMPDRPGVRVAPGRHASVVSNSTREIGGVRTATVIASAGQGVESTMLATVEEVFHVFWLARHPSFRPNEMARYAYPVRDVGNAAWLLAEDEALARALNADSGEDAARWAAAALQIRRARTPALSEAVRVFETALETMEGTANYVARRALGQGPAQTAARLRTARPADGTRWRFYDSGAALCFLLDRVDADWKTRSDKEPEVPLADLLAAALARAAVEPHTFSGPDLAGFDASAATAVAQLVERQQRLRVELLARPGARIIITVGDGAEPFAVKRFDPINLFVLDAGEVAQANFITLAGPHGSIELTNPAFARQSFAGTVAITVAAGPHPLANGIRQVTIVGVQDGPRVEREKDALTIVGKGLRLELRGADARADGETLRVTVPGR